MEMDVLKDFRACLERAVYSSDDKMWVGWYILGIYTGFLRCHSELNAQLEIIYNEFHLVLENRFPEKQHIDVIA